MWHVISHPGRLDKLIKGGIRQRRQLRYLWSDFNNFYICYVYMYGDVTLKFSDRLDQHCVFYGQKNEK